MKRLLSSQHYFYVSARSGLALTLFIPTDLPTDLQVSNEMPRLYLASFGVNSSYRSTHVCVVY